MWVGSVDWFDVDTAVSSARGGRLFAQK
jgi:hypothetical protein